MTTDDEVKAALSDLHAFALTLYGEAVGEPIEGLIGVANVIVNRKHAQPGRSWRSIVHQPAQFSCWSPVGGDAERANYGRVMGAARVLAARQTVGAPGWLRCLHVAEIAIAGGLADLVHGARHYCTVALFKAAPPSWAAGRQPDVVWGKQAFFAGVA